MNESVLGEVGFHFVVLGTALPLSTNSNFRSMQHQSGIGMEVCLLTARPCRANPIPEVVLRQQTQGESLDEISAWHTQKMREAEEGA